MRDVIVLGLSIVICIGTLQTAFGADRVVVCELIGEES